MSSKHQLNALRVLPLGILSRTAQTSMASVSCTHQAMSASTLQENGQFKLLLDNSPHMRNGRAVDYLPNLNCASSLTSTWWTSLEQISVLGIGTLFRLLYLAGRGMASSLVRIMVVCLNGRARCLISMRDTLLPFSTLATLYVLSPLRSEYT